MSGVLKTVGKVFKKIVQSPIFKIVAIAAAVYFTGGLAAGAMGSTFAASLPGIAGLAGDVGLGTTGAFASVGVDAASVATSIGTGAFDAGMTGIGSGAITDASAVAGATADAVAPVTLDTAGSDAGASLDAATGSNAAGAAAPALDASGAPLDTSGSDAGSSLDNATGSNGAPSSSDAGNALDNSTAPGSSAPGASAPGSTAPGGSPSTTTTGPANVSSNYGPNGQGIGPPENTDGTSAIKNVTDWVKANPTMAQILGKAASTAGSSVVNAISANAQMNQQQQQYEQTRQDIINRGGVPSESAAWKPQTYKTPGVVNAALNASTTSKG